MHLIPASARPWPALLAVGLSLVLFSCAPQHPKDMQEIERLRAQAESLVQAQSRMGFESWAYGTPSNQDSLYKANAALFTRENIALVQRAEREEPDSLQQQRLRYFLRYLTTEYIAKQEAPLTDSVANLEASAVVMVHGNRIPFRQVQGMMVNERSQQARADLSAAEGPIVDSLTAILSQVEDTNRNLARELGYASYNTMVGDLKEIDIAGLKKMATEVLASTDSLYRILLQDMLKRNLGLTPDKFFRSDIGALMRNRSFDKYFPGSSMLDQVEQTYAGLGIDVRGEKNLIIDDTVRAAKNPRAVCFPIDVPGDIRLSIKPSGGFNDYDALYHEMGHAQHYAHTTEHSFEFRYAGEPTVTENYAFLSEYILSNPAWLRLRTSMPTPVIKDFLRFQVFYRIFFVRRYCAKYLYELGLHDGTGNPKGDYARILSAAVGNRSLPSDEQRYLVDLDPLLYSAGYLRAWFLESELNARLTKDFGANWFENPKAGDMLRSLWAFGDRLDGTALSQRIGYGVITAGPWLAEMQQLMLYSTK